MGADLRLDVGVLMSAIDWGDVEAWAAAGIAVIAAGFAAWQAYEARKVRTTAAEALTEAKMQTAAAMTSADAAQRSVQVAREQAAEARRANYLAHEALEQERAERYEAAGPDFTLTPGRRCGLVHSVTVTMTAGGPYQADIEVTWVNVPDGDWYDPEENTVGGLRADNVGPHVMTRGSSFDIGIHARERYEKYEVIVHFVCREIVAAGQEPRTWTRSAAATLKPPGRAITM